MLLDPIERFQSGHFPVGWANAVRMYNEIVQRPGILLELKREAQRRIDFLTN